MEYQECIVYEVTRDLTIDECFWLEKAIPKGTIVFKFYGYTYGCISSEGIAVSFIPNENPFFEVPLSAVKEKHKDNVCLINVKNVK
jgi:hypothetical protein